MYDANWFYSSLAQCAAAVVGLLGAVLATRLQSQFLEVRAKADALRDRLRHLQRTLDERAEAVSAYGRFVAERIPAMRSVLSTGDSMMNVQLEVEFWGGRSGGSPWPIAVNDQAVSVYEQSGAFVSQVVALLRGQITEPAERTSMGSALEALVPEMPQELRGGALSIVTDLRNISRALEEHERAVVESIKVPALLAVILSWLCVFGLIVPLWYLSSYTFLSKTVLLAGFAVGIMALPAYVAREVYLVFQLRRVH